MDAPRVTLELSASIGMAFTWLAGFVYRSSSSQTEATFLYISKEVLTNCVVEFSRFKDRNLFRGGRADDTLPPSQLAPNITPLSRCQCRE
ncbi:hypothetical protein BOTBODRAFT_294250 [Botryobasidium botryosum FD-172 SS1]|uniref:Uncharacterized protein n=1 Tax=Botryobasidium botryosum (strain FD-172 SS1) TaxID=930990 RepID=A0A067MJ06_BOTB1|nr:hypothetical protein BOTBODRAFT_294250 [Botryobasidium botryosum FD-172 SS1]